MGASISKVIRSICFFALIIFCVGISFSFEHVHSDSSDDSTINITLPFQNDELDSSTSVNLTVRYANKTDNAVFADSVGSCYVNISSQLTQLPYVSASEVYHFDYTFTKASNNISFGYYCNHSENSSFDISYIHTGTITVYPQLKISISNQTNYTSKSYILKGIPAEFKIGIQNMSGVDLTPPYTTVDECQLKYDGNIILLAENANYYYGNITFDSVGNHVLNASCRKGSNWYDSFNFTVDVTDRKPLLEDSGLSLLTGSDERSNVILSNSQDTGLLTYSTFVFPDSIMSIINLSSRTSIFSNQQSIFANSDYQLYDGFLAQFHKTSKFFNDLFYTGFYYNEGNLFDASNSFSQIELNTSLHDLEKASGVIIDSKSDGINDVIVFGNNVEANPKSYFYNFIQLSQPLPNLKNGMVCTADFNKDGFPDIYLAGNDGSNINTSIWLTNETGNFTFQRSLDQLQSGSCTYNYFLNHTEPYLFVFGDNGAENEYYFYDSEFNKINIELPNFSGLTESDVFVADFDSDGLNDIIMCGENDSNKYLYYYKNNESNYYLQSILDGSHYNVSDCSLSASDYDSDGDLDLALSGVGGINPIKLFNNTLSEYTLNQPPIAIDSDSINISYNNSKLFIEWNATIDDLTPQDQLSYNLQVEKINGDILLSGRYPLSTHPAQGYRGNMQFATNYTLNNISTGAVRIKVQAIDNGLAHSAWAIKEFNDCISPNSGNWIIDYDCSLSGNISSNVNVTVKDGATFEISDDATIGYKSNITIDNGTLFVFPHKTLSGNNSNIILDTGNITIDYVILDYIGLEINRPLNISESKFLNAILQINNHTKSFDVKFDNITFASTSVFESIYEIDFEFKDQYDNSLSGVKNNSIAFSHPINLTGFTLDSSNTRTNYSYDFNFSKRYYYNNVTTANVTENETIIIMLKRTPEPLWDSFLSLSTTNFTSLLTGNEVEDRILFSNLSSVNISNSYAKIQFHDPVNLTEKNLSSLIVISENSVYVNNSLFPAGNAAVTVFGISYTNKPVILKNDELCADCLINYYSNNVSFNVTGFSTYTTAPNSKIELLNDSYITFDTPTNIFFSYHNYSNDSEQITATCNITTAGLVETQMDFNISNGYNYTITFSDSDLKWNQINITVSCFDNISFEAIEENFTVTIIDEGAWFVKEQEYEGVYLGSVFWNDDLFYTGSNQEYPRKTYSYSNYVRSLYLTSVSISDLDNDGINDLVALGSDEDEMPLFYYEVDNLKTQLTPLKKGSVVVSDYDNDGDNDIIACGENSSGNPETVIYQNNLAENYFRKLSFTKQSHSLPNLKECSISYGDINLDNKTEYVMQGAFDDTTNMAFEFYFNGTDFNKTNDYLELKEGESIFYDYDLDGDLDMIQTGDSIMSDWNLKIYSNNQGVMQLNSTLSEQLTGLKSSSIVYGEINQNQTLILIGEAETGLFSTSYIFNGTNFTETKSTVQVQGVKLGSSLLFDKDNDNDLDLFVTGAVSTINKEYISILYQNTQPTANSPPTAPIINGSYNNVTSALTLNWTQSSDDITPAEALTYNLRIGDQISPYKFYSSEKGTSSNPTQGQYGNQFSRTTANLNLPDSCFNVSVQAIDGSYTKGAWSDSLLINNHAEICDGYDNDCDGLIDETWDSDNDGYYDYQACPFYATLKNTLSIDLIDCDDTQAGFIIGTGDSGGSYIYEWKNSACSKKVASSTSETQSNRETSASVMPAPERQEPVSEVTETPEVKEEELIIEPETETSKPKNEELLPRVIDQKVEEKIITNTYSHKRIQEEAGSVTRFTEIIKAKAFDLKNVTITIKIAKSVAETTDDIIKIDPFIIIERDPVIQFNTSQLNQFKEISFQYAFNNKNINPDMIQVIVEHNNITEDEVEKLHQDAEKTKEVINLTKTYVQKGNETIYNINVDFKDNETILYNVSIFEYIPKCLLEIIKEQSDELESNMEFEIIDEDPMVAWHFDKLLKGEEIQLKIKKISDEDCMNEGETLAIARDILLVKQEESGYENLYPPLIAVIILITFFMSISHFTREKPHSPNAYLLVKKIKILLRKRYSLDQIKNYLDEHHADKEAITEAINAVKHPIRFFFIKTASGLEFLILLSLIVLNIIDFMKILPGDVDFFKKVISWILLAIIFNHIGITKVLFGKRKIGADILLLISYFLLTIKNLIGVAKATWNETSFVRDLYAYIINHSTYVISITFILGCLGLFIVAIYLTINKHVHKESLIGALFIHHTKTHQGFIIRFVQILFVEVFFFILVFNLMFEWLAIAVDAPILVAVLMLSLISIVSKRIKRHYKETPMHIIESISETPDTFYERMIELFHHPKFLPLGLAGMFVLHIFTEIGIYVIPYTLGFLDPVYINILSAGHMPIFSVFGNESLFSLSIVGFSIPIIFQFFTAYLLNIISLFLVLFIPIWIWSYEFKHKNKPLNEMSIFNLLKNKDSNWHYKFGMILTFLFPMSFSAFLLNPAFEFKAINIEQGVLAGVDILTKAIPHDKIIIGIICIISTLPLVFIDFKAKKEITSLIVIFSVVAVVFYDVLYIQSLFMYVIFLGKSLYYLFTSSSLIGILQGINNVIVLFFMAIALCSIYFYSAMILIYMYMPVKWKNILVKLLPKHIIKAQGHHHIHYLHQHDDHLHGNKIEVLKHHIEKQLMAGHELFLIVEHLREHDWEWGDIDTAIIELQQNKKNLSSMTLKKHPRHSNLTNINKLTHWLQTHYENNVDLTYLVNFCIKNKWDEEDVRLALKNVKLKAKDKHLKIYLDSKA